MSACLEPERVSIRDIPGWARESWGLLWRRPAAFVAASVAFHLLALAAGSLAYLSMPVAILVCHIFLLITIAIAEAADLGRNVGLRSTYARLRGSILCLLSFTVLYAGIFVAAAVVAALLLADVAGAGGASRQPVMALRWIGPGEISFMILYMGTIVTSSWFLAPLLALHDLGTADSRALARRAFDKNDIVILVASNLPFFAILVLASISEFCQLLSLGLVPLFAIYQYVSYRHVFLGRKQNQPVAAKQRVPQAAQAASR